MENIRRYFKRTDKTYLLLCIFSSVMAVTALSSWAAKQGNGFAVDEITGQITGLGDYRRAAVQAGAALIGLVIAVLLSNIDYRSLVKVWPVHVALTWGMVLPTLVLRNVSIGPLTIGYNAGDTDNYSWYKLGGFTLQPTELAKISFILTFAMHLNNVRTRLNEPKELGKLLLHLAVPILIIHVQGDDGTAIIYAIIGCCMMFAAGLSWKYILGAVSAAAVAMATAFAFFSDKIGKGYQWYRILAVIDPDNKTGWAPSETIWKNIIYQQQRGEIALGSGGIFGNGLFGGSYYSVPNAHNDFILSWIGNAAGFVGCCVVLGVLFALLADSLAGRPATCKRMRVPGTLLWQNMMCQTQGIRLAAQVEVLLGWHNLQDRKYSELKPLKRLRRAVDRLLLRRAYMRAVEENPALERLFVQEREQAVAQMELSAKNYTLAAEPMSNIYGALYSTLATDDPSQRKSMHYIGCCIGLSLIHI